MTMDELTAPPVLSTPAENLFDQAEPIVEDANAPRRSDEELRDVYEIERTAREIRAAGKRCVALQFPDSMLADAPRVFGLLEAELLAEQAVTTDAEPTPPTPPTPTKLYILADSSYSACCVDEVAAEHADADMVVHYGRACLSPTSRLPVVYVFTKHELDLDQVVAAFVQEYKSDENKKETATVVLMADVTYQDHVPALHTRLQALGYTGVLATRVVHNPQGRLPNRQIVDADGREVATKGGDDESEETKDDNSTAIDLHDYAIFHLADPPKSLLLALATRVKTLCVYSAASTSSSSALTPPTAALLGRRYAKVLRMATAGIIGILVNTLSVRHYMQAVERLRRRIADAGKKSYLVVVGKLNAVKLANFAEIDGWVVVGCWESSLVEDDAGFFQPVVTPFELEMALKRDDERVWGLDWWGGLEGQPGEEEEKAGEKSETKKSREGGDDGDDEAPQFDLLTGRLVTTSRPMRQGRKAAEAEAKAGSADTNEPVNTALALRGKTELATINGVVSPGAEFLRSQRTWKGLGTDFDNGGDEEEASTLVEEGRSGIARGYVVGDEPQART